VTVSLTRLHVFTLVLLSLLALYASNGVRGTDQYWYVGDVEKRLAGDFSNTTTIHFPGQILRDGALLDPNHILHNGFALDLATWIGHFFGAYDAWVVLNLTLHFLVSVCLYWSAQRFVSSHIAGWVSSIYLLSPIAFWQSINPLLEMSFAALTALCMLGYVYRQHKSASYLLTFALMVGVASHPIFIIPAATWLGMCLYSARKGDLWRMVHFGLSLIVIGTSYWLKDWMFPSSFQPNLQAIIASAVPGKSNMLWQYAETQPPVTLQFLFEKFLVATNKHFFAVSSVPLYLFTNAAVAGLLYLLSRHFTQYKAYILPAILFLGLYAAMIVLQQNHPRYQQIVAPISFLVLAIVSCQISLRSVALSAVRWVGWGFLGCLLVINIVMAQKNRSEGAEEAMDIAKLAQTVEWIDEESLVVSVDVMPHNPMAYFLWPREVLAVRTKLMPEEKILKAVAIFEPEYVVSTRPMEDGFPVADLTFTTSVVTGIFKKLYFYRIEKI